MNIQFLDRKKIRQQARLRRQKLSAEQQQHAALKLSQQLIKHPQISKAQHIALYLANDGELCTLPFIQWCWQQNKKLYLPVIHPFSQGQLLFLHFNPKTTMISNKYGIKEPKLDIRHVCLLSELDVLLTPLVAFDLQGNRLGMGGGFYDRTLATWYEQKQQNTHKEKLSPIGLAHDCQQLSAVPTESWDIPLPEIITPSKSYLF